MQNVPNSSKNLETILVISTGFLVLYILFNTKWFVWLALGLSLSSLLSDTIAFWINKVWLKLGHTLGWINTRIILTIIFFIILVPVAFLSNLFSGNKLQLKNKKNPNASYYTKRDHTYTKKDLENMW